MLAVFHGDYLYAVTYDVPFRVVRATAPTHPTGSLLTVGLHGDAGLPDAPPPQLSAKEKVELHRLLRTGRSCWVFAQHTLIATLTSGPLFRKLMSVAVKQDWSLHLLGAAKLATFFAALAPLGLCLRFSYSFSFWRHAIANGALCEILRDLSPLSDLFWYLLLWMCSIYSTIRVVPEFWHHGGDVFERSWMWSFQGVAAFVFLVLLLDFLGRAVRLLGGFHDTEWQLSAAAIQSVINTHPEWQLHRVAPRTGYDAVLSGDELTSSDEADEPKWIVCPA